MSNKSEMEAFYRNTIIRGFWILRTSGQSIYHKNFGIEIDEHLFSGFLSAMMSFAKSEVGIEKGIESMEMGDIRFVYLPVSFGLIFVIAGDKRYEVNLYHKYLEDLKEFFITQLEDEIWKFFFQNWKRGELDYFSKFLDKNLNKLTTKWEIELITEMSNKEHLLKIYEDLINTTVTSYLDVFSRLIPIEEIIIPIQDTIKRITKGHKELSKIEISERGILNYGDLDVEKMEIRSFSATLENIFWSIVDFAKEQSGEKPVDLILKKCHPIIYKNKGLIRDLNLEDLVLKLLIF
ncbi:MAG TPA: hypothetical protein VMV49_06690 [Candidatus Deferrimicrobium sp.]|nr:hypothetical protein [Candidatus Deferrimicrobium sp.]